MGQGEAVCVIEIPQGSVDFGEPFFQDLFECIGDAQLTAYHNAVAVADSHAEGFHQLFVTAGRHGAQIMAVIGKAWRGDPG